MLELYLPIIAILEAPSALAASMDIKPIGPGILNMNRAQLRDFETKPLRSFDN